MLKTRIPPPLYALFAGLAMAGLHQYLPGPTVIGVQEAHWAWLLALPGGLLAVWAVAVFRRAGTTVDPTSPSKARQLVIVGPYQLTRNPMYLGLSLGLLAWAGWLGSLSGFLLVPVFVALVTYLQIVPEERALEARFGDAYAAYRRRVNRWIGPAGPGAGDPVQCSHPAGSGGSHRPRTSSTD